MSINSVADARFDHVDEDGELVFVSKGLKFRIPVDDTLEHAILEARQILSETDEASNPGMVQTLPISSIQALIRAGAQPDKVAEKYGLSQALVRRFSAAVETEKQYAIEQFLAVSAPKGSKVHSVEDLIARTLAAAHIGMESVKWGATRRGREPWLISAIFSTQRNRIRAEWTWNMHDNTVECQNTAAQILLGERDTSRQSDRADDGTQNATGQRHESSQSSENADGASATTGKSPVLGGKDAATTTSEFKTSPALPGDSVRSARIASTVASMQEQTDEENKHSSSHSMANSDHPENNQRNSADTGSVSLPYPAPTANLQTASVDRASASSSTATTTPTKPLSLPDRTPTARPQTFASLHDATETETGNSRSDISGNAVEQQNNQAANNKHNHDEHKHGKRKSGRSAVPSWDEILFGE